LLDLPSKDDKYTKAGRREKKSQIIRGISKKSMAHMHKRDMPDLTGQDFLSVAAMGHAASHGAMMTAMEETNNGPMMGAMAQSHDDPMMGVMDHHMMKKDGEAFHLEDAKMRLLELSREPGVVKRFTMNRLVQSTATTYCYQICIKLKSTHYSELFPSTFVNMYTVVLRLSDFSTKNFSTVY
jgi:hypothetical protein